MRHLAIISAAALLAITAAEAQTTPPVTSPTPDMPGASNVPGEKLTYQSREPSRTGPAQPTRPPLTEVPGAYDIPEDRAARAGASPQTAEADAAQ